MYVAYVSALGVRNLRQCSTGHQFNVTMKTHLLQRHFILQLPSLSDLCILDNTAHQNNFWMERLISDFNNNNNNNSFASPGASSLPLCSYCLHFCRTRQAVHSSSNTKGLPNIICAILTTVTFPSRARCLSVCLCLSVSVSFSFSPFLSLYICLSSSPSFSHCRSWHTHEEVL